MAKIILTTVLDPEIKDRLSKYSKKNYIPYRNLLERAIRNFKVEAKKKNFVFKHNDFNRIKTQSFTCSMPPEVNKTLIEISEKLNVSKRYLLREIISEYVLKNC
jgi:predicted transcriptional regulator